MKVALVYDRVNKWGGAERVLLALHEMFPQAPLYTAVYNPKTAPWAKVFPKIHTSFLQNLPFARSRHDLLGWLMPLAFESFNFDEYDLVISITSEAAKGILTKPETRHLCYCLTPTRYLWSHYDFYFKNPVLRVLSKPVVSYLRKWDRIAAQRPNTMVGISKTVVDRIKKYYERDAGLIYPPVDVKRKTQNAKRKTTTQSLKLKDYFLVVSRLVPYKRVDLVVEAFNRLNKPLVIVGSGSEEGRLRRMAKDNIAFVGQVEPQDLWKYYKGCIAFIAPQEEDFGIAAVEAQASGKPVIAYRKGGATETVRDPSTGPSTLSSGPKGSGRYATGLFFDSQTPESLTATLKKFKPQNFDPQSCKKNAARFSKEKFLLEFDKLIPHLSSFG